MLIGNFSSWLPWCQINCIVSSLSKLLLCYAEVFIFSKWHLLIKEFYLKCSNISSWLKNNQRNQTASRSSPFAFTCHSRRTEMGFFLSFLFFPFFLFFLSFCKEVKQEKTCHESILQAGGIMKAVQAAFFTVHSSL